MEELMEKMLKERYSNLKKLSADKQEEELESMNTMLVERNIIGFTKVQRLRREGNYLKIEETFLKMAKWIRLISKDPEEAKSFEEIASATRLLMEITGKEKKSPFAEIFN